MPRRPTAKASRALNRAALKTPITSGCTTPLSSALPSTYTSEIEFDPDDPTSQLAMAALTLDEPTAAQRKKTREKRKPFRFMDLPGELRIKVYAHHFAGTGDVIDLDPDNHKRIHQKLAILRTSRTVHAEASHVFFSTRTFRIFPTIPGRPFKTKKPLLARLTPRQRSCITSLELRLGPGFNKPPRGWVVNPALGLSDCLNVRRLTVFVECDPSDNIFNGFRVSDGFYEEFSASLLYNTLNDMTFLDRVHFDAWTSVKKTGVMMRRLMEAATAQGRRICWGPERGWTDHDEAPEISHAALSLGLLGAGTRVAVVA
ncbi:hypothetical protein QBC39DRAFT_176614 [Podospora conica]|nr:hypothetical protein QBC39DRAFT_176614 [Schizothecium conicum]